MFAGYEVLAAEVVKSSFWDIKLLSAVKINRHLWEEPVASIVRQAKQVTSLVPVSLLISCLDCSSTLSMEATFPSEMSVDLEPTTRCY